MNVVSEQSGDKAVISVQQKIPLQVAGAKKLPAGRRAATVQPTPRAQPSNSLIEYGRHQSRSGNMLPPPVEDSSRKDLAKFASWAEDAINNQQKDIDRIGGAVARIEKDMKSFKEFMSEVRAELAATRATRKTQEELKEEQLAWLREDLKELRQENGDFQQDMREEELPSIHNELEQLRQQYDSNNGFTELSNRGSLQPMDGGANGLRKSVMRIDHKVSEMDGLKMELKRLQQRLSDIEEKRQDSFVFPKTLMDHPGTPDLPSAAVRQMRSTSTTVRQRPRLMFEAPHATASRSRTNRDPSPTPPGAFPDSVLDLDTPRHDPAALPGVIIDTTRPRSLETELEPADTTTRGSLLVQKWSYTGARNWRGVNRAFQAFEIEYPKLGATSESIKVLEDYVNEWRIQNSLPAQRHGKLTVVEEITEDTGSCLDEPEPSLPKRKHDQIEDTVEQLPSETVTKRRKRVNMPAGKDQSVTISFDHGSPELGRQSRLRSGLEQENAATADEPESALDPVPANFHTLNKRRSSGRLRNSPLEGGESSAGSLSFSPRQNRKTPGLLPTSAGKISERSVSQRTASNKENEMLPPVTRNQMASVENSAARSISARDAAAPRSAVPGLARRTATTPAVPMPKRNAVLQSIEAEDDPIPGSFPEDVPTPASRAAGVRRSFQMEEADTDSRKPYKCASCGKRYKNSNGLKYVGRLPPLSTSITANNISAQGAFNMYRSPR